MDLNKYDGFYFVPSEDNDLDISFFVLTDEYANGVSQKTDLGDWYHISFYKPDEEGKPIFDDYFQAILSDPFEYAKNFQSTNLFGCIVKKTDKSDLWMKKYLKMIGVNV